MSPSQGGPVTDQTPATNLADRPQRLIESERGAGARVINFGVMEDGHAGLTFGFDVAHSDGAPIESYVLKMAPAGVVHRGNTDVFRQASLLRALGKRGLPVPEIPLGVAGRRSVGDAIPNHGAHARAGVCDLGAPCIVLARA